MSEISTNEMNYIENLAILPKEREEALLTIKAMQHPNQIGMHADWWIKWLRRSVALDALVKRGQVLITKQSLSEES